MTREVELDLVLHRIDRMYDPSFRGFLVADMIASKVIWK